MEPDHHGILMVNHLFFVLFCAGGRRRVKTQNRAHLAGSNTGSAVVVCAGIVEVMPWSRGVCTFSIVWVWWVVRKGV